MTPSAVAAGAAAPRPLQPDASRILRAADIHLGAVPPLAERRSADPSVSVVIPALNEAGNITPVIQGLPGCVTEIIVVDGRSTDDTVQVALAADPRARVVMERRKGKGVAMLSGFACARGDVICAGAQFVFVGRHTGLTGPPSVVQAIAHHDDHLHVRIKPS